MACLLSGLMVSAEARQAAAQFGFPGLPSPRIGLPLPVPGGRMLPGVGLPLPGIYGPRGLGRTLGIIGAVAIGAVILSRLSVPERREVARRAKVVVEKDQNERVVDSYRTKDGRHQVTVTAEPVQKAGEFVEDPALQKIAEVKADGAPGKQTATAVSPTSAEVVSIKELPQDTACRRVTTDLELASAPVQAKGKTQQTAAEAKQTNVSIMCQTNGGEWKPAGA